LFNAAALPVLVAARDLIHLGFSLLGHPLYGNYRPHQQPYRTLLLKSGAAGPKTVNNNDAVPLSVDEYSLHLIEEAINVYQSVPGLSPDQAPQVFLDDCAFLDYELMRLTLSQAGWPAPEAGPGLAAGAA
jgi:hypothetical protein